MEFIQNSESISSKKYLLNCQSLINKDNPTTLNWLDNLQFLKTIELTKANMTHKKNIRRIFA